MQTIARYLVSLKETLDGDELYGLISRTIRQHTHPNRPPDTTCLIELHRRLGDYAQDPIVLANMRIRARLLQQHITPYLPDPALAADSQRERMLHLVITSPSTEVTAESKQPHTQLHGQCAVQYQTLRRSEQDAWQAIYRTVKDYQQLKQAWMKSLEELAQQRETLTQQLSKTSEQLQRLETEHERLRLELEKTQRDLAKRTRLSTAPELLARSVTRWGTLPKRDIFIRELDAEIRRSKRSGAALSLGLIDIEWLDSIANQHDPAASTAVLRCYVQEVLGSFRAYDLVGQYDRDQFAVMFPDTAKDGAQRALEKAHKRASETHVSHGGASFALPPFAGALVVYSIGEDTSAFLERAHETLAQLRRTRQIGVIVS